MLCRDTRDHTDVNELVERILEGRGASGADLTLGMAFDKNGNMLSQQVQNGTGSSTFNYTYDAWNRLVLVELGSTDREIYEYDGLHQRIVIESDSDAAPDGTLDLKRDLYYDAAWPWWRSASIATTSAPPGVNEHLQSFCCLPQITCRRPLPVHRHPRQLVDLPRAVALLAHADHPLRLRHRAA